jgi:uncharacterized protein (TIGR02271 family)
MASETIVAVFDTAANADAAVRDLENAGVPSSSIKRYAKGDTPAPVTAASSAGQKQGFWAWLLGKEDTSSYDRTLYDRTIESGGTVVTVIVDQNEADRVVSVLDAHSPANLEERASQYGLTGASATTTGTAGVGGAGTRGASAAGATAGSEKVIPIAEETLDIGKRMVNRGTARIRRYVVESPVEEQVRLRDETVSIERRPVRDSAAVAPDAFTEKTVEVTETAEEAVVAKKARVKEEVVVKKDATERVETVRDTVRREEVDVDRAGDKPSSGAGSSPTKKT